jgi:hypothetical protein
MESNSVLKLSESVPSEDSGSDCDSVCVLAALPRVNPDTTVCACVYT